MVVRRHFGQRSDAASAAAAVAVMLGLLLSLLAGCSAPSDDTAATSVPVPSSSNEAAQPSGPSTGGRTPLPTSTGKPATPSSRLPAPAPASGRTATPSSLPGTTQGADAAGFRSTVTVVDAALADRMGSSWRPGCPVALTDLRYVTVTHRGFENADHQGELVVASAVADDVVAVFHELYDNKFPIASLRLVDEFAGSDDASMAADNSSAFNCRKVTGGSGYSEHSYGTAIDLNPVQNPYVAGDLVLPEQGRRHLERAPGPGVIIAGDATVRAFARHGFRWGGSWTDPVDYQHFSISGR